MCVWNTVLTRRHITHLWQGLFQEGGTSLQQIPTARITYGFRLIPTTYGCYENITLRNTEHILCTPCISNSAYKICSDCDASYTKSTIQTLKKKTCCKESTPPVNSTGGFELATCTLSLVGGWSVKASSRYDKFQIMQMEGGTQLSRKKRYTTTTQVAAVHNVTS